MFILEKNKITKEQVEKLYYYDENSGNLIWRVNSKRNKKAGDVAGGFCPSSGYMVIKINGNMYYNHRIIWLLVYGEFPKQFIDHIDMNRGNNRLNNLRLATNQQNQPKPKNNTSGYKGIYKTPSNKWRVRIFINDVQKDFGSHSNIEDAINIRNKIFKEIHGEYYNED
jgi:hypothetical protein